MRLGSTCRSALLKLDFRNAFNSVRREKVLEAVQDLAPEIYPLPTLLLLFFGTIRSSNHREVCNRETHLVCFCFAWLYTATVRSPLFLMYPGLDDVSVSGSFEDVLVALPGAKMSPERACLLGSPLGCVVSIDASLEEKIEALKTMGACSNFFFAHDALALLHHSFAIPKLNYLTDSAMLPVWTVGGVRFHHE